MVQLIGCIGELGRHSNGREHEKVLVSAIYLARQMVLVVVEFKVKQASKVASSK